MSFREKKGEDRAEQLDSGGGVGLPLTAAGNEQWPHCKQAEREEWSFGPDMIEKSKQNSAPSSGVRYQDKLDHAAAYIERFTSVLEMARRKRRTY